MKRNNSNPYHLPCRTVAVSLGRMWLCKQCNEKFQRCVSTNRRSIEKDRNNAWCIACKRSMKRCADLFVCTSCRTQVTAHPKRAVSGRVDNPSCLLCRRSMTEIEYGLAWRCNPCESRANKHLIFGRPAQTMAQWERYPCCIRCHRVMEKHGGEKRSTFHCPPCRTATLQFASFKPTAPRQKRFSEFSAAASGWSTKHAGLKWTYPWCVRCKRQMHRAKQGAVIRYRCYNCSSSTKQVYVVHSIAYEREQRIVAMIRAGYQDVQIAKKLHSSMHTIAKIRPTVKDIDLCDCGRLKYHTLGCRKKNELRAFVQSQRPVFDALLNRLTAKLPKNVPAEMRDDVRQALLLSVIKFLDHSVKNSRVLIDEYNRLHPYDRDLSLDVQTDAWAETLVAKEFARQHFSKREMERYNRDRQILKLVGKGYNDVMIVEKLHVAVETVRRVRRDAGLGKTGTRRYLGHEKEAEPHVAE